MCSSVKITIAANTTNTFAGSSLVATSVSGVEFERSSAAKSGVNGASDMFVV